VLGIWDFPHALCPMHYAFVATDNGLLTRALEKTGKDQENSEANIGIDSG
jgi:hypothetical protein